MKIFSKYHIPTDAIPVTTYADFHRFARVWATGSMRGTLIVIGPGGTGKTQTMRAALGTTKHLYVATEATPAGLHAALYDHLNQPVVLDDLDALLANTGVTGMLKSLLETTDVKTIQRINAKTLREEEQGGRPAKFETTSRTCLLCNELRQVSQNFEATLQRCTILNFTPTADELSRYVATWFDTKGDADVYEYVSARLALMVTPSCRYYHKASEWKRAGLPWQTMLDKMIQPDDPRVALVKEIMHLPPKDRERLWHERSGGQTRQTYFKIKRAIDEANGTRSSRAKAISARKWKRGGK